MKLSLGLILVLITTPLYAQDLNLKVTPAEAELIWKGVRKLPVEEVDTLMGKLRQQVMEQTTPKPVERKEDAVQPPSKP